MPNRPRPIFILEALAVFGIFGLYVAEFLGVPTVSTIFDDRTSNLAILSFTAGDDLIIIPQITVILLFVTLGLFGVYFSFIRPRLLKINVKK